MNYVLLNSVTLLLRYRLIYLYVLVPCTYTDDTSSKQQRRNFENIKDIIIPKQLSCFEVKEFLMKRNSKTQVGDYQLNSIDCTKHFNINLSDSKTFKTENLDQIFYQFHSKKYFGTEAVIIELKKDNTFLSPSYHYEERFGDLYTEGHDDKTSQQCFYSGHIIGDNTSMVTANKCNGMV